MSAMQIESAFPEDLARRLDEILEETGDSRIEEIRDEFQALLIASRAARSGRPARGGSGRRRVTGSEAPEATARSKAANRATIEAFRDKMSTRLMEAYRTAGSTAAFGLLYEVNCRLFLNVISSRLRKFYFPLDPQDVLQEVFFNIYRYPHKFQADKDQAFRHWASMIIRNTVYKCTRERDREITHELQDDEIEARADRYSRTPLGDAIRVESRDFCSRAYLLFLHLYLSAYQQLSSRERQALHMVEVDGEPYKVAAEALGIRLENLKMVIFRARKKILRMLDHAMAIAKSWQADPLGPTSRSLRNGRRDLPGPELRRRSSSSGRLRSARNRLDDVSLTGRAPRCSGSKEEAS